MSVRLIVAVPVVGLLVGSSVGVWHPNLPEWVLGSLACGFAGLGLHAVRVSRPGLLVVCVCGAFTAGGAALAVDAWQRAWNPPLRRAFNDAVAEQAPARHPDPSAEPSATVVLEGRLRADAAPTSSGLVSLSILAERIAWRPRDPTGVKTRGGVLLTVVGTLATERLDEWRAGRRIRAPAELRRPGHFLDPGIPDSERALARRGTVLVGTVKSGALVEVVAPGSRAEEWAGRVRAFARRALRQSVGPWSARSAAIVTAILIGDRTGLDQDVERRLQEAGVYHVIAISGGNVAILAGLTLSLFRLAGLLGRSAMLAAAAGLVAYGYVVVGGASVTRATLMAVVYFVGRGWDLRSPPLHGLLLVAGVMTLLAPLSVVDSATLLTFGATGAIVAVASAVRWDGLTPALRPAATLVVASLSAEAVLLPVSATLFQRVTFAGLVLNLGAIPLMAVAQLAGMAVVPAYAISPAAARLAGLAAHIGAEGLVRTADLVAFAPWLTWRVGRPDWWAVAFYYLAATSAWSLWRPRDTPPTDHARSGSAARARWALAGGAAAAAVFLLLNPVALAAPGAGRLRVTFIDVGQGDAALIRLPRGSSLLIDAGGLGGRSAFDIGDRVVGPVLRHAGIRRLDGLVLSHGDADHVAGALTVLREFRPWDVWEGIPVPPSEPLQRIRNESLALRARWTTVHRMDTATLDGVQIAVRHPDLPDWERQDVRNDDSIVLELRWRNVSVVFTGDIGREVESDVARLFAPAPLRVVKVPHHGSATSSSESFVQALAPAVAVVSVGRGNAFGHPSPVVIRRYEAVGAAIYRTDRDGAVDLDTDGTSMDIRTFTGRSLHVNGPITAEEGAMTDTP